MIFRNKLSWAHNDFKTLRLKRPRKNVSIVKYKQFYDYFI